VSGRERSRIYEAPRIVDAVYGTVQVDEGATHLGHRRRGSDSKASFERLLSLSSNREEKPVGRKRPDT